MRNKFAFLRTLALLSSVGFLSAMSNSAMAVDGKSIPGTNCIDQSNQNDVSYHAFYGYLTNDVNGNNRVQCPVVRDTMAARNNHFNFVRVQLRKFNSTSTHCSLDSRNRTGSTGSFRNGSVGGTGYKTLSISQPIQSYYYGPMNISCGLQDNDQLHGYNYEER